MSFMPRCQQVARNLSARRDSQLHGWAWFTTQLHLALCSACRHYAHDIDDIHRAIQSAPHEAKKGLSTAARERMRTEIEKDHEDA